MHDPLCVAFVVPAPVLRRSPYADRIAAERGVRWGWLRRYGYLVLAGRCYAFRDLVTVWHREPQGHDAGTVCDRSTRAWHVHHWKLQIHPLQVARRWLLTRCTWCGGPHRRNDPVNISDSRDHGRAPWWRGEQGLYHWDCHAIMRAHAACLCPRPRLDQGTYGQCSRCGKHRSYGVTEKHLRRMRLLVQIPAGKRDPEIYARYRELVEREERESTVVAEAERIVRAAAEGGIDV